MWSQPIRCARKYLPGENTRNLLHYILLPGLLLLQGQRSGGASQYRCGFMTFFREAIQSIVLRPAPAILLKRPIKQGSRGHLLTSTWVRRAATSFCASSLFLSDIRAVRNLSKVRAVHREIAYRVKIRWRYSNGVDAK